MMITLKARWFFVTVFVLMAAVVLAACGSDDDGSNGGTPTREPVSFDDGTPTAEGTPTAVAVATADVDPNAELTPYTSERLGYTIGVPPGFDYQLVVGIESFIVRNNDGTLRAQLTLLCNPLPEGATLDTLASTDGAAVGEVGSIQPAGPPEETTVAGLDALRRRYTVGVSGAVIEHDVVYVITDDCGWRIGFNTYGRGTLDPYVPLFDRILETLVLPN